MPKPRINPINCKQANMSLTIYMVLPGGLDGKESVCSAKDPGLIPGSGRWICFLQKRDVVTHIVPHLPFNFNHISWHHPCHDIHTESICMDAPQCTVGYLCSVLPGFKDVNIHRRSFNNLEKSLPPDCLGKVFMWNKRTGSFFWLPTSTGRMIKSRVQTNSENQFKVKTLQVSLTI